MRMNKIITTIAIATSLLTAFNANANTCTFKDRTFDNEQLKTLNYINKVAKYDQNNKKWDIRSATMSQYYVNIDLRVDDLYINRFVGFMILSGGVKDEESTNKQQLQLNMAMYKSDADGYLNYTKVISNKPYFDDFIKNSDCLN